MHLVHRPQSQSYCQPLFVYGTLFFITIILCFTNRLERNREEEGEIWITVGNSKMSGRSEVQPLGVKPSRVPTKDTRGLFGYNHILYHASLLIYCDRNLSSTYWKASPTEHEVCSRAFLFYVLSAFA